MDKQVWAKWKRVLTVFLALALLPGCSLLESYLAGAEGPTIASARSPSTGPAPQEVAKPPAPATPAPAPLSPREAESPSIT